MINDTVIWLDFEDDKLFTKHIRFNRKKFDSLALFKNLEKELIFREGKGEVLTMGGLAYGERFSLKSKKNGYVYEVVTSFSSIRIIHTFAQPRKREPSEPPPVQDTVKTIRL